MLIFSTLIPQQQQHLSEASKNTGRLQAKKNNKFISFNQNGRWLMLHLHSSSSQPGDLFWQTNTQEG